MSTINIDSKLLEALQLSTCFGLAHDDDVPECKQCDVKGSCKAKMDGALGVPVPTIKTVKKETPVEPKPKATKPATKTPVKPTITPKASTPPKPTASKPASAPSGNTPDFKPMTLPELEELARERKVEWKDYGNDNITRMRLIMSLKKSY